MAELRYTVVIGPDDGAFSVIVPAFPEISTYGATPEEAPQMARDAITLSLSYRRDKGLEIPASDTARPEWNTSRSLIQPPSLTKGRNRR